MKKFFWASLFLGWAGILSFAQTMGTAKVPLAVRKATLMVETAMTVTNTKYVSVGVRVPSDDGKEIQITPTNWVSPRQTVETIFTPIGSGVVVEKWGVNFFVTAAHVVKGNEDVFFRIPQVGSYSHRSYKEMHSKYPAVGWVYSTNSDIVLTAFAAGTNDDFVSFPLDTFSAKYEEVSPGDEVVIAGFPSSVIQLDSAAVGPGMVSAMLPDKKILISGLTFPGNSGGPVFWKSFVAIDVFGNKMGEGRLPCLIGLVLSSPVYQEGASSQASGRMRIMFEQNAGMTEIVSTSRILELLEYPEVKKMLNSKAESAGNSEK